MAYVDRDKLYDAITDLPYSEGCAVYDSDDVENTIRNFPEADVVEVVRCKDCKHKSSWKKHELGYYICGVSGFVVVEDIDYCSYGERKEVEQ